MTIKRKVGMAVITAAVGVSLLGGGTYAWFNDVETIESSFASGTIDLGVDPTIVFDVNNLKPGDHMTRKFTITNNGTLDIHEVLMFTQTEVYKNGKKLKSSDEGADFATQLRVDFLSNEGKIIPEISGKTLAELESQSGNIADNYRRWLIWESGKKDLPVGHTDRLKMKITFVPTDERKEDSREFVQNKYQGLTLKVTHELEATQKPGQAR
ncbi:CalY family protein [Halalkalibacterium halodurans]|uniref:CalY family protein n=1 Tax=Halalkalibacterium halodurans TaxID=86665 RepID=UPI002AA967B2|nr:CalY family protein [Halalkalibacterium halodurans]MDY7222688.1 CalY family protein [Halalkalibacterium halodurans]MDY7241909.1 CalY family protein [Halalkalibacterium halodurans]